MTFEVEGVRLIKPLDPYQGHKFTEMTSDKEEPRLLDQLYKITTWRRENYINPTIEGSISWRIQSS